MGLRQRRADVDAGQGDESLSVTIAHAGRWSHHDAQDSAGVYPEWGNESYDLNDGEHAY